MYAVMIDNSDDTITAELFEGLDDALFYGYHRLAAHGAHRFDVVNRFGDLLFSNVHVCGDIRCPLHDRIRKGW